MPYANLSRIRELDALNTIVISDLILLPRHRRFITRYHPTVFHRKTRSKLADSQSNSVTQSRTSRASAFSFFTRWIATLHVLVKCALFTSTDSSIERRGKGKEPYLSDGSPSPKSLIEATHLSEQVVKTRPSR